MVLESKKYQTYNQRQKRLSKWRPSLENTGGILKTSR